jgi:hypothetical protein
VVTAAAAKLCFLSSLRISVRALPLLKWVS